MLQLNLTNSSRGGFSLFRSCHGNEKFGFASRGKIACADDLRKTRWQKQIGSPLIETAIEI
jgi:hypothetical protein